MRRAAATIAAGLGTLLAGCANYDAMRLPSDAELVRDVRALAVDASTLPTPALRAARFDPSDGLDITEVAMLAVAANPELRAARADLGVARAQAFDAGLLPDPQLALSADHVLGGPPGSTLAYSAGLALDLGALLARPTKRDAAEADARKVRLDLLWQEWQTVAKARGLFVKIVAQERALAVLDAERDALRPRLAAAQAALDRGLLGLDQVTPLRTAVDDATRQWTDLARQRNQARHDLDALLGVAPEVELRLVGPGDVAAPGAATVARALAAAPSARPDLLALQAGLAAQDDRYRGAILAQFPAITIGATRARDTSDVNTIGPTLGLSLPLFNRNRGQVAIERATRERLLVDYRQRLATDAGEAHRLFAEQALVRRQLDELDAGLPALRTAAAQAARAYAAADADAFTLTTAEGALVARELEQVAARQALQEQAIALQALLGAPWTAPAPEGHPE